jgi:hypothetical protein
VDVCRKGNTWLSWEDYINMDLKGLRCEGVDRIHLAQEKHKRRELMKRATKILVILKARNFLACWKTIRFSRTLSYSASRWVILPVPNIKPTNYNNCKFLSSKFTAFPKLKFAYT